MVQNLRKKEKRYKKKEEHVKTTEFGSHRFSDMQYASRVLASIFFFFQKLIRFGFKRIDPRMISAPGEKIQNL